MPALLPHWVNTMRVTRILALHLPNQILFTVFTITSPWPTHGPRGVHTGSGSRPTQSDSKRERLCRPQKWAIGCFGRAFQGPGYLVHGLERGSSEQGVGKTS